MSFPGNKKKNDLKVNCFSVIPFSVSLWYAYNLADLQVLRVNSRISGHYCLDSCPEPAGQAEKGIPGYDCIKPSAGTGNW